MKYFKHGDRVTATDLNAMVDAINAVEVQTAGFNSYAFGSRDAVVAGTVFYGVHQRRWLVYRSTGEVRTFGYNPATPEIGNTIVLPDCNEEFCMFDLHTVGWLKYGDLYEVEGSEYAMETDTNA